MPSSLAAIHAYPQSVERMKLELESEAEGRQVTLDTLQLDLGSFRSTRECVDAFKAKNLPLHLLINNAGVWPSQKSQHTIHRLHTCMQLLSLSGY